MHPHQMMLCALRSYFKSLGPKYVSRLRIIGALLALHPKFRPTSIDLDWFYKHLNKENHYHGNIYRAQIDWFDGIAGVLTLNTNWFGIYRISFTYRISPDNLTSGDIVEVEIKGSRKNPILQSMRVVDNNQPKEIPSWEKTIY